MTTCIAAAPHVSVRHPSHHRPQNAKLGKIRVGTTFPTTRATCTSPLQDDAPAARGLDGLALMAQRGDLGSLSQLMRQLLVRLRPLVRRLVLTRSCDVLCESDVDDVLQDLILVVWQHDLPRFDPSRSGFVTFVSRRMRWHLLDRSRVARRNTTRATDGMTLGLVEDASSHPETLLHARHREDVLRALPHTVNTVHVDAQARHALKRHDIDGATLFDVARELNVHVSTACRARQRGLRQLARHLTPLAA